MRLAKKAAFALIIGATLTFPLMPVRAGDEAVPDLKGEWLADTLGIGLGNPQGGQPADGAGAPVVQPNHIVMTIDFQAGRNFAGIKRHRNGRDRFVGVVRSDNRSAIGTDAEGDMNLRLLGADEMEVCYTEHSRQWMYATCGTYRRQH